MCDLDKGFKLCTCDGESLKDPDWILERRDQSIPEKRLRGRVARRVFSDDEKSAQRLVIDELNNGACFDFPYEASEGDVFIIKFKDKQLRFRRHDGAWGIDKSNGLTPWRSQMVEEGRGTLGPSQ
jgi:hypothetical protein